MSKVYFVSFYALFSQCERDDSSKFILIVFEFYNRMPENPINNILIKFTFNGGSVGGNDYDYYYHWITKKKTTVQPGDQQILKERLIKRE